MFDIGFTEITLIAVIGLLVIGPERLPRVARDIGLWVGRIRRYVTQVRADIEREVRADELREQLKKPAQELKEALQETEKSIKEEGKKLEKDLNVDAAETGSAPSAAVAGRKVAAPSPAAQAGTAAGASGATPAPDAVGPEKQDGAAGKEQGTAREAASPTPAAEAGGRAGPVPVAENAAASARQAD